MHIEASFPETWKQDIFEQQLFDLGFDTIDGNDAYISSEQWAQNADQIEALCASTEEVKSFRIEACPDENWNAVWEAEHPIQELPLGIRIIPHCAFGAGHHETTSMLINSLLSSNLTGKNILDHGTGTGVLAIYAKRLGAAGVVAIDIDDKSVENAKENAALNKVDLDIRLVHENENLLNFHFSPFHLILANIHRNILLAHMETYARLLASEGQLWLSGFYESDCPALITVAEQHGLRLVNTLANGDWRALQFIN
jgi:ribosomal protein L11 methyltransferase